MAWACEACTFQNASDDAVSCQVCQSKRPGVKSDNNLSKKPASRKTVQSTLFGGIAPKDAAVKKKSRKRKAPPPTQQVPDAAPLASMFRTKSTTTTTADESSLYATRRAKAQQVLQQVFGFEKLRHLQPQAIECALKGQSQIVVMATGSGKSICYQLPAVVLGGLTLVVSPLIALMKDQVEALVKKGVQAAVISSANRESQNVEILERVLGRQLTVNNRRKKTLSANKQQPPLQILYCAPEQVQTERFRNILRQVHQQGRLSLFALDEAHCLSEWGHDFRKAFRQLHWLRSETFADVPCMALTATATPKVLQDIKQTLHLQNAPCHMGTFNRENIYYKIRYKDVIETQNTTSGGGVMGDLIKFIQEQHRRCSKNNAPCSGIVYVHTRKDTEELAGAIQRSTGIPTAGYHGGLKAAVRNQVQEDWTEGKIPIVIATIAFGMGIDKREVRYVVHWTLSKSVEAFYQESGRAGRDGLPSYSLLYYSRSDTSRFKYLIQQQQKPKDGDDKLMLRKLEALEKMDAYCTTSGCRRCYLLKHFGEKAQPDAICQKTCDYCSDPSKVTKAIEAALSPNLKTGWSNDVYKGPAGGGGGADYQYGDDFISENADLTVGSLNINHAGADESADLDGAASAKPSAGQFQTASSILDKYEAIECNRGGEPSGFVRYRPKDVVSVPKHLTENMPDPLQHLEKKKPAEPKTSAALRSEAERLRQEIAKAKKEREAKLRALNAKKARAPPPPPPPTLSFGKKPSSKKRKSK